MKKRTWETFHHLTLTLPGVLEKIVAFFLMIGVLYGCVRLGLEACSFPETNFSDYMEELMTTAFNIIIVIELIRMLVKHSMNTIVEVMIFTIARGLVIQHEEMLTTLIRIGAIAILLLCRKFLFHSFDFDEGKQE